MRRYCLKNVLPSLFQIASDKEASIAEVKGTSGEQLHWNISFSRAAQDWEMNSFADFYSLLYSVKPSNVQKDGLWWVPAEKGVFSVRSFYKALTQDPNIRFSWRRIGDTRRLQSSFLCVDNIFGQDPHN